MLTQFFKVGRTRPLQENFEASSNTGHDLWPLGLCQASLQLIPTRPRRCTMRTMNRRDDNSSVSGQPTRRTTVCGITCPEGGGGGRRSAKRIVANRLPRIDFRFWRAAARAPKCGTGRRGIGARRTRGEVPPIFHPFSPRNPWHSPFPPVAQSSVHNPLALLLLRQRRMGCGRTARRSATRPARPRAWPSISFDPVVFAACHAVARA